MYQNNNMVELLLKHPKLEINAKDDIIFFNLEFFRHSNGINNYYLLDLPSLCYIIQKY